MKPAVSYVEWFFSESGARGASAGAVLAVLLAVLGLSRPQPHAPPPQPGVDVLAYDFALRLTDTTDVIQGEADITVGFTRDGVEMVRLDLDDSNRDGTGMTVAAVTSEDRPASYSHEGDRLVIRTSPPPQTGATRTYTVTYEGVPADGLVISTNKHGDRTFFGDNWPDRARHWLPTVDHPSDKAKVRWSVTAPDHYQVVGNGRLEEETDLLDGYRLTRWHSTVPLATKIMVIGAARFAVDYVDEDDGISVQSWVYPQDRVPGFVEFARADTVLAFFRERLGPFPYEKLANVQSKTRYGGMENASAIFYNEDAATGTGSSEALIAHEVAHQWFGNAVTEAGWPHIWLSEGFATYLAALYLEHMYGAERLRETMASHRERVLAYHDRAPNALMIDSTTTDLMRLLNPNSYQKGAWILHMLRQEVGTDAFWEGLRTYYRRHQHANATTDQFQQVMEDVAGRDLSAFFDQWLTQPGQPRFRGTWSYDADTSRLRLTLEQTQSDALFRMPLEVGIYTPGDKAPRVETVTVDEREEAFSIPLDRRPTGIVLDPAVRLLYEGGVTES